MDRISIEERERIHTIRKEKRLKQKYRELVNYARTLTEECEYCGSWNIELNIESDSVTCSVCRRVR